MLKNVTSYNGQPKRKIGGVSVSTHTMKKCKVCEIRIQTDEIFCPCCKTRLGMRTKRISLYQCLRQVKKQ